ncbi:hypothetical protein GCM10010324_11160 [Streptomyces hiroshimensis]|uniref:Uncharacterized protein n=1 Tax=Streptomyces hiroshimensis TaxID=66424 RepID=A0ABQ2Y5S3_9ACTN|nr:hypothetical protein FGW37_12510 [Streptomyces rectiverticillatus]GGX68191.1 hypothetical protein GCM10010324_11160 [Streptomyces hiroshimensis]
MEVRPGRGYRQASERDMFGCEEWQGLCLAFPNGALCSLSRKLEVDGVQTLPMGEEEVKTAKSVAPGIPGV